MKRLTFCFTLSFTKFENLNHVMLEVVVAMDANKRLCLKVIYYMFQNERSGENMQCTQPR